MLFGFSIDLIEFLGLFLFLAGFIIGLGAVTVIDIHGFLGRKSPYWSEATTRTHKVTKPLIWMGILLVSIGQIIFYKNTPLAPISLLQAGITCALILNGCFLSFRVSPFLLEREKHGKARELLPRSWQRKIMISLILSDIGWWSSLMLLTLHLVAR